MKTKNEMMWEVSREQEALFKKALNQENVDGIIVEELFDLIRGTEYRRGKEDGRKEYIEKQKVRNAIKKSRNKIDYVLCYGLKGNLKEQEIKTFKNIFRELYEKDLLKELGLTQSPQEDEQVRIGVKSEDALSKDNGYSALKSKSNKRDGSSQGDNNAQDLCQNCGHCKYSHNWHCNDGDYICIGENPYWSECNCPRFTPKSQDEVKHG